MKTGSKRFILLSAFLFAPFVWAQPISTLQFNALNDLVIPPAPALNLKMHPEKEDSLDLLRYGTASWYSESDAGVGRWTASGELFDDSKHTCASWDYEFGTLLEVTNLGNGRSVTCRVNDRGPAKRLRRSVDLSKSAFSHIASTRKGLARVSIVPHVREVAGYAQQG